MKFRSAIRGSLMMVLGCLHPWCIERAGASLGGDAASVAADADFLRGVDHTTPMQQYEVHEFASDGGTLVREFLDRDGRVFAVTWRGPEAPDLVRLLGANFPTYSAALSAAKQAGLHRSVRVVAGGLVVERGGHMRAVNGRAYLPALIPAGLSAADIH